MFFFLECIDNFILTMLNKKANGPEGIAPYDVNSTRHVLPVIPSI